MVLDAFTVVNQNEINFIESYLRPLGLDKHVFFLLNRWNMVEDSILDPSDPKEVEKVFSEQIRFINTRLVPIVGAAGADKVDKRIFKVNALGALKRRLRVKDAPELETTEIPAFERALREFLTVDRDAARRDADLRVAEKIEKEVASDINMDIHNARIPIGNFNQEKAKLDAQLEQLKRIKINIENNIRAFAAEIANSQTDSLETYLTDKLFGRLKEQVDKVDMGPLKFIRAQ